MKRYILTSIFALVYSCLVSHAGTLAVVTVTLRDGDQKPRVAETTVDISDRVTLPLFLPNGRVWSCEVHAWRTRGKLEDSDSVINSATVAVTETFGTRPLLKLFSGSFKGSFHTGDKVVIFRSGDRTLELEIKPEMKDSKQGGEGQTTTDSGSKSKGSE